MNSLPLICRLSLPNRLQRLAAALLWFISSQLQPPVLRDCLHTLRILSRDRRALGPLVSDSALYTLSQLGGLKLQHTAPPQDEGTDEDWSLKTHNHTPEEGGGAASPSASSDAPEQAAAGGGSNETCSSWRGDGAGLVLDRGKKDTREENSEEEEKEEDGEVCRKEALKVLCNVIYNSPRAQERASALR